MSTGTVMSTGTIMSTGRITHHLEFPTDIENSSPQDYLTGSDPQTAHNA